MKTLLLVIAVSLVMAQDPAPEVRDDKYKDDPHASCFRGKEPYPGHPSMHPCQCALMCVPDESTGQLFRSENAECEMYCTKSRCKCHPDQSCDVPEIGVK